MTNPTTQPTLQKIHTDPRMALNSLGKYLTDSSPTARRRLVKDQKFPKEFKTLYYRGAVGPVLEFFEDPDHSTDILIDAADSIDPTIEQNPQRRKKLESNRLALEKMAEAADQICLHDYVFRRNPDQMPHLLVGGVAVSVRPEFELMFNGARGGVRHGALKLYFSSTAPLAPDTASLIATTVHQYAETHARPGVIVDPRHCYVLDVFAKQWHQAPTAFKRRREAVENACEEVAAIWDFLQP